MRRDETLRIGLSAPGLLLRVLVVLVAVAAATLLGATPVWLAVVGVLAVFGAVTPVYAGAWMAAAVLVGLLIVPGPDGGRAALVVAAVHALHVLGALSLVVPATARVSLRALRPTAVRFAWMQAVGQVVVLAIGAIPSRGSFPLAVIAGAAAVFALTLGARLMLGPSRLAAFPRAARRSPSADAEPSVGGRS
ncbi:hypothetical protein FVO59_15470 [Microbacterium esteraromaticum]|uniref:Uncharacterized protein n=1 Tax=Microbacterium esteraromaticum TaxID=57043 RepID=A0A7D8AIR0_9MICO|nr:hypothetical protein [Microbacterium esteraromaticum]QMU98422.1 hypothetical protein FVO59_15470 [Microbacterium esteraromaticum]